VPASLASACVCPIAPVHAALLPWGSNTKRRQPRFDYGNCLEHLLSTLQPTDVPGRCLMVRSRSRTAIPAVSARRTTRRLEPLPPMNVTSRTFQTLYGMNSRSEPVTRCCLGQWGTRLIDRGTASDTSLDEHVRTVACNLCCGIVLLRQSIACNEGQEHEPVNQGRQ